MSQIPSTHERYQKKIKEKEKDKEFFSKKIEGRSATSRVDGLGFFLFYFSFFFT